MLDQIRRFRTEYLQGGGRDANILSEIVKLEEQIQSIHTNRNNWKSPLMNLMNPTNQHSEKNLIKDKETEIELIEMERDKLIAEFELKKLKL